MKGNVLLMCAGLLLPVLAGESVDWDLSHPMEGVSFHRVASRRIASIDRPTPRFSRLQNLKGSAGAHAAITRVGEIARTRNRVASIGKDGRWQNITGVGDFSTQYAIQCGWDGKPLWLLFDTGSSDTWTAQVGFECRDQNGDSQDGGECGFGEARVEEFAHGEVESVHFYLQYGSGEEVSGPMGYSDIACGGLLVSQQQVGLANDTFWHGNNVTVGVLGLAFPSITSGYYGDVGDEAPWNAAPYTSFFTNAITQGTIDPVFSVSIIRNSSDGILAWGGLPEAGWQHGPNATTALLIANLIGQPETAWKHSFYTIVVDGLKWDQTTVTSKYPYIVDTGTTMMYCPPTLAESIADAFQPRAVYQYQWGAYFAPCDAIPPRLAVTIAGVDFWLNPSDLMYKNLVDPLTGYCAVAVASGGSGPYILGDVFLQNVVAVFDVGAAQMRFYGKK
ncbi:hypothetical protein S40288_06272 [Stachybotrys chartarum IBT 40288]|nr:hypothetical protein S40288_06272 [Stachybotrys chartarum IBT 40288]